MRHIQATLDVRSVRVGAALVVALIVWLFFMAEMSMHLASVRPEVPASEKALDVKLIVLEPPPVEQVVTPTAAPQTSSSSRPKPATRSPTHVDAKINKPTLRSSTPTREIKSSPVAIAASSQPQHVNMVESPDKSIPSTGDSDKDDSTGGTPLQKASAGASAGAAGSAARAISQPLPDLPGDLREVAYRAEALARLTVHVDGSVDVELLKPTSYPRLNQLLLEALRKWRFFPAINGGHPVESQQNVRVHFNVS